VNHYLLLYDYVDDYLQRRTEFRALHVAHARESIARGELVLGGAFADEPPGAALMFFAASPHVVEDFARADPYVLNGLVTGWRVREWVTVVGQNAAKPI
jgi:uncharacterized protein YciI